MRYNGKQVLLLILVCAAVLTLFSGCSNQQNESPESVLAAYFEAVENKDADQYLRCLPPPVRQNQMEYVQSSLETVPEDIQMNYEIVGSEDASDQIETYQKAFQDNLNVVVEIQQIQSMIISISAASDTSSSEPMEETVYFAQIDGKWYLLTL